MSEGDGSREFRLTGSAARDLTGGGRKRRITTRKTRQKGGEQGGTLMQLVAQSAPAGSVDQNVQSNAMAAANATAAALRQIGGPAAILVSQRGGDNSGALMQIATNPHQGAAPEDLPKLIQSAALQALQSFGPNKAQQFGGRKGQRGGDVTAGAINIASSRAPTLPGAPAPSAVISGVDPSQPAPVGGARVVLLPHKRRTRVALKAKKHHGGSESSAGNIPPGPAIGGTRKARKIHLRVKGITSRLAKAKKAKKLAMAAPIGAVRAKLEAAKVIKKDSKAPESMLRTMYADLLITKKGL
jgi:hypothetical protein